MNARVSPPATRPDSFRLAEPLEPRLVLAADIAAVGYGYDFTPASSGEANAFVYIMEGEIADDGSVGGTLLLPGGADWQAGGPTPAQRYAWVGEGRYHQHDDHRGFRLPDPVVRVDTAQFLASRGFPIGWSLVEYGESSLVNQELALIVQRPTNATLSDLQGSWTLQSLAFEEPGHDADVFNLTLTISGTTATVIASDGNFTFNILSVSPNGLVITNEPGHARFYLSHDKATLLGARYSLSSEDDSEILLGYRAATTITAADIAGDFRVVWTDVELLEGREHGEPEGIETFVLRFAANNTWLVFDTRSYDLGVRTPMDAGTWSIVGNTLRVRNADNEGADFALSSNRSTLFAHTAHDGDAIFGLGVRVVPLNTTGNTPNVIFSLADRPGDDRALVWQLGDDRFWRETDVQMRAGGPPVSGDVVSWERTVDLRTYAAAISGDGLIVYRHNANGTWSFSNLTAAVPGAENIVSQLRVMVAPDLTVHLTGLNAEGDLVQYFQIASSAGLTGWGFQNITDGHLRPNDQPIPAFTGDLITYATAWGGLNVAGLDAQGQVWSIWWAPGAPHWFASNLSIIQNADPFVGGLTVYLTPWDGINIAGIDHDGKLAVVWWVPSLGGDWQKASLTDITGGPRLTPQSVSSYVSSWGALNVVGFDDDSGEVKVYWWVPAINAWNVSSLSAAVGPGSPGPTHALRGVAAPDGSLNVLGFDDSEQLVRYYWQPGFAGTWLSQNLTDGAIPG